MKPKIEDWTEIPAKCEVCKACKRWRNKEGLISDQCIYGGPYTGYIEVKS